MGAGELIQEFKRSFFSKSCYTKRKYYLKVLVLFQTFQKIPPLPYRDPPIYILEQETRLTNVAELIGLAMRQAATDAKEDEVNTNISKASDALRDYIKTYCSVDLEHQHRKEMANAIANDQKIEALLLRVGNELQTKMEELGKKSAREVDLYVSDWTSAPHDQPNVFEISGPIKIEHDATLSMLIHRYMEYMLRSSQAFHILHLLRLNPQIYRHFPVEQHHWSSNAHILTKRMANGEEVKYITSVNPATTIKNYQEGGGSYMYLIFDRYDPHNRTIAIGDKTYPLPDGYTTGWLLKTKSNTRHDATLRINSLDYTLYHWDLKTRMDADIMAISNDIRLDPNLIASYSSELSYVSTPAIRFPEPQHFTGSDSGANLPAQAVQPSGSSRSSAPLKDPRTAGQNISFPRPGSTMPQLSPTPQIAAQPTLQAASTPSGNVATLQPGETSRQLSRQPQAAAQATAQAAPSSRANGGLSSQNHVSPGSSSVARQTPPKSVANPPQQTKTASGKSVAKQDGKVPAAIRRQHKGTGGPSEMIEEENKGGWFGSLIKSGLQKLGAYGGSPK